MKIKRIKLFKPMDFGRFVGTTAVLTPEPHVDISIQDNWLVVVDKRLEDEVRVPLQNVEAVFCQKTTITASSGASSAKNKKTPQKDASKTPKQPQPS